MSCVTDSLTSTRSTSVACQNSNHIRPVVLLDASGIAVVIEVFVPKARPLPNRLNKYLLPASRHLCFNQPTTDVGRAVASFPVANHRSVNPTTKILFINLFSQMDVSFLGREISSALDV